MEIRVKTLDESGRLPEKKTKGAAGADLYAASDEIIYPKTTGKIKTGIAIEVPEGYVGLIFARSSMATRDGLAPANKVGIIDSDYRGEVIVPLYNQSSIAAYVHTGQRIAQLIIVPVLDVEYKKSRTLSKTKRGDKGFGSTGL